MSTVNNHTNPFEDEYALMTYNEEVILTYVPNPIRTSSGYNASCPVCGEGSSGRRKRRFYFYAKESGSAFCFNTGCPINEKAPRGLMLAAMLKGTEIKDENLAYIKWYKKQFGHISGGSGLFHEPEIAIKPLEQEETPQNQIEGLFEDHWVELPPTIKEYCEQRKMFNTPFGPENWAFYFDKKTKRLVIPWNNRSTGQIEYWQKRALLKGDSPKYLYPIGLSKSDFVFNLENISEDWPYILMTEGCVDAAFSFNTVAIGGIKPSVEQLKLLNERYPRHKLVVAIDNPWVDWSAKVSLLGDFKARTHGMLDQHKFDRLFFVWDKNCPYKDINECVCAAPGVYPFESKEWLETRIMSALQAKLVLNMY